MNAKELIYGLRGVDDDSPNECCGCGETFKTVDLLPEEAGQWVCRPCLDRWDFWDAFAEMFPVREGIDQ